METLKRPTPSLKRWFALLVGILIPTILVFAVTVSAKPSDPPQPQFLVQVKAPEGQPITSVVRLIGGEEVISSAIYIPGTPIPFAGFGEGEHLVLAAVPIPEDIPALANSQRRFITVETPIPPSPAPLYTLQLQHPNITGTVLDPWGNPLPPIADPGSGEPLPKAVVHLRDKYGPFHVDMETNPDGEYSLAVPQYPDYMIGASPNPVYTYSQSFPKPVAVFTTPIFVPITLTVPAFEGQIFYPNGAVVTQCLSVWLENMDGDAVDEVWACGGSYHLGGVPTGTYRIAAEGIPELGLFPPPPIEVEFHGQQHEIHDLHLQYPQLAIHVEDFSGAPIPAEVEMYTLDDDPIWRQPVITGQMALIGGRPLGDYCFIAWPTPNYIPALANSERICLPLLTPTEHVPSITLRLLAPTAVGIVRGPNGGPLPLVHDEDGNLIAPATVIVHDMMTGNIKLLVQTNLAGEFSFALPDYGDYEYLAHPNGDLNSFLSKSPLRTFSYPPGAVLPIDLGAIRLTRPRIVGVVQKPNGKLVSTQVHIWNDADNYYDETWFDAQSGLDFVFGGMPGGLYYIQADPPPLWIDPMGWGPSNVLTFTVPPTMAERVTLTLRMPNVTGQVCFPPLPPVGDPCQGVGGVDVHVFNAGFDDWGTTQDDGRYTFGGLPLGDFAVEFFLPPDLSMDWRPPHPMTFTLHTPDEQVNLGRRPLRPADKSKVLIGAVHDESGNPIGDARIVAWHEDNGVVVDRGTEPDGAYMMTLGGGVWKVGVKPDHPGVGWLFDPHNEQWVTFPYTPGYPITKTAFFTVTSLADAFEVTGIITSPDGSDIPQDSVFAHLCTDEGQCIGAPVRKNGAFTILALPGPYTFKAEVDPETGWVPPQRNDFPVVVEGNQDLGLFQLRDRANPADMVRVIGRVIVTGTTTPRGLGGVPMEAWTDEGDWAEAETITTGYYSLLLFPGHWHGGPALTEEQQETYLVLRPRIKNGYLEAGDVLTNVNFFVQERDAVIRGRAVNLDTEEPITDTDVFVSAEACNVGGDCRVIDDAVTRGGYFQLHLLGGYTYTLSSHVPGGGYMPGPPVDVFVDRNESVTTTVGLIEAGTQIYGNLVDQDLNNVAIEAYVYGSDSDGKYYVEDSMWPEKPGYTLNVPTPDHNVTWTLSLWVPPETGYVADPTRPQYQVFVYSDTAEISRTLYVQKLNQVITGTVTVGGQNPARFVTVFIEGTPDSNCSDVYFETTTDENGEFSAPVLPCNYDVGAYLPPNLTDQFFPPDPQPWTSMADNPIHLNFRPVGGINIFGSLTLRDEGGDTVMLPDDTPITVLGWSDDAGNRVVTGTPTSGYRMRVLTDTTWHVWAVYEDPDNDAIYASDEAVVDVLSHTVRQDLVLTLQDVSLPDPICETFDPSYFYRFSLPAYGHLPSPLIEIPAGAMPVTDTVEICATPKQAVARGKQLIGFGYALSARDGSGQLITDDFNKSVRLIFYYNEDALGNRDPNNLQPAFYSNSRQEWVALTDVYVDPEDQFITGKTDHFTDFGLLSNESEQTQYSIYLPLVVKNP